MAWYHVNGCDCPIGCCYCADDFISPQDKLINKIVQRVKEVTFKAKHKKVTDGRRRELLPFVFNPNLRLYGFVSIVDPPTFKECFKKIDQLHKEFNREKEYNNAVLRESLHIMLEAFSEQDQKLILKYLTEKYPTPYDLKE